MKWTSAQIPSLQGKTAIVTGANIGLGLEIATQLALHGARVALACRNPAKANDAVEGIRKKLDAQSAGKGSVETISLDCAKMASVRAFNDEVQRRFERLDILVLNAGVMAPPKKTETEDGFEIQLAVNALAPFVTVAGLMPLLKATEGSRVVFQSSSGNYIPKSIPWDDLNSKKHPVDWAVGAKYEIYGLTKLYDVLLPNEFQRRLDAAHITSPKCMSAHPGLIIGQLQDQAEGTMFEKFLYRMAKWVPGMSQTYEKGALPVLFAATSDKAQGGRFCGYLREPCGGIMD